MKHLCIAVHDVAPTTWPQCERLVRLVDALGGAPLTLLVTPDFHRRGRIDQAPDFMRAIDRRLQHGDELALHGYEHRDAAPPPRTPADWMRRRVLTAGEGEFAALSAASAAEKLARGLDLFARVGWSVGGFVPPAWLASAGTMTALRASALRYTSTHSALIALPGTRIAAPCLSASARSPWRRGASKLWLRALLRASASAPLLRVALHPTDALHDDILRCWEQVLGCLLAQRGALTKSGALDAHGAAATQAA